MAHDGAVEYIRDVLEQFAPVLFKRMFGGYGIYKNGLIFAIILDGELYFKSDDYAESFYNQHDSQQFTYLNKAGKIVKMPYWKVPNDVMDDEDEMKIWFEYAYNAALMSKK